MNSGGTFNDKAALDVLRVYRATLAYAGISGSVNNQPPAKEDADPLPLTAKVGDLVQVEVNGAFQFKQPKRIDAIKLHDGKHWAFLEGEKSGIEMSQVIVQEPGDLAPIVRNTPPQRELDLPSSEKGLLLDWSEETLIDDGGDEIKIRYKGKASRERYEFIRDYLDFKIQRLTKKPN